MMANGGVMPRRLSATESLLLNGPTFFPRVQINAQCEAAASAALGSCVRLAWAGARPADDSDSLNSASGTSAETQAQDESGKTLLPGENRRFAAGNVKWNSSLPDPRDIQRALAMSNRRINKYKSDRATAAAVSSNIPVRNWCDHNVL